ncbi:hypothetical protein DXG01_016294, partial [Tephrocybe rancida]
MSVAFVIDLVGYHYAAMHCAGPNVWPPSLQGTARHSRQEFSVPIDPVVFTFGPMVTASAPSIRSVIDLPSPQ